MSAFSFSALSLVFRSKSAEKLLFKMVRFEMGLLPRFAPKITDSNSDLARASISSLRPGAGGLAKTGGAGFLAELLRKPFPDLPDPETADERGSIPFSTTASRTDSRTIIIVTTLFMSSDVSGLSSSGFTLLAIAVAATRASLTAAASREGLGGGVVGEIITAHIIRGIDFLLGFGTLALRRRIGPTAEKPGVVVAIPNRTRITTPAGYGGALRTIILRGIIIFRVIRTRSDKITKRDRFETRHV